MRTTEEVSSTDTAGSEAGPAQHNVNPVHGAGPHGAKECNGTVW